jgi:hypothetical protein
MREPGLRRLQGRMHRFSRVFTVAAKELGGLLIFLKSHLLMSNGDATPSGAQAMTLATFIRRDPPQWTDGVATL